jgi:hypothetical protein
MGKINLCCPSCGWKPDGRPHWKCNCGTVFNTFDTNGECPTCKKQWEYTQCVEDAGGCSNISIHEEWYQGLDKVVDELFEELHIEKKSKLV